MDKIKQLDIDTTGWIEISCDVCGSVTSFQNEEDAAAFGCLKCNNRNVGGVENLEESK